MKKIASNITTYIVKGKLYVVFCAVLIVYSTLLIDTTSAQSLDSLIVNAIDENLELKILEKEYLAALEKAPQVSQRPDPEVGIGVFPLPVETRLGAQLLRVGATQMFPWRGVVDNKKDLEIAKAKVLFERISARALDVSFQVKQAYFSLYEIEKSQLIISRNLEIFKALDQLALAKVASGKASATDVLRVQLKTEELKQELNILEVAKTKPTATINQLLNRSLENPILIIDNLNFADIPYNRAALLENIEANHPMLRMFKLQQEVAEQAKKVNTLSSKPTFGVGLDYIMVNKRDDADPNHNGRDIVQLRGSVKIPLYKKKYDAKEREENLKIAVLSDRKTDLLNRFETAIEQAYTDYQTAQLRMNLYQKQIEISKAAINILETNYSTSGRNFDELLQLEKELINYDLKMLKAIIQSHSAKSKIDRFVLTE